MNLLGEKNVITTRFKSVFVASMVSMVSSYILMLTDNIVAGQFVGDDAVAAMTLIFPVTTFLLFISYIIADGLVMLASYAQGKNDREEVNRLFSLGIILSVASSIIFFAGLWIFKEKILSAWEISKHLEYFAAEYYSGIIFLSLFVIVNIFIYTIFMAEGNENACVIASAASFVVNVALDIILCKFFGVFGIGLTTTIGTLISVLVQVYFLFGGRSQLKFKFYWSTKKILLGIFYSFYHSVDTLCISILPLILSAAVIEHFGEFYLIIVTVAVNLLTLIIAIYTGLVDCLQPMICQYHAEKNLHSVKKTMQIGMMVTIAVSLFMTVAGIIFADFLPGLFGVSDSGLADIAATAMRYFLPFTIFLGCTLMYANYYIYIEKMNFGAAIKIILLLILPFVGIEIGGNFSMNMFWLMVGGSFAASFLLNFIFTRFFKGRNNLLLMDEKIFSRQLSYDINTNFDEVMNLTRKIDADLTAMNFDRRKINKIVLIVEEIGLQAVERAGEKIFQMEFSILPEENFSEPVTLIIRDNGEPFDIIQTANEKNYTFREFFIESVTSKFFMRNYLPSGDENRFTLKI